MALWVLLLRMLLVFVLAFAFGYQRQRSHKPIGFGTYTFVAIGACALAITASSFSSDNPLPLLGAIVTGIGFLGAGALIRTGDKIFGFTNAASIWVFAIIGLVIGMGEYFVGLFIYALLWVVIAADVYLESRGMGSYQKKLIITTNKIIDDKDIKHILLMHCSQFRMFESEINKKDGKLTITYLIEGTRDNINKIPKKLYEMEWFDSVKIE